MNILEHPIYKDIYDLCQEIEKLPASEQETKCVVMASNLEKPVAKLLARIKNLEAVRIAALAEVCRVIEETEKSPAISKASLIAHRILACSDPLGVNNAPVVNSANAALSDARPKAPEI